ncbi:MAG: hypothetical protein ABFS03_10845 [Chloroflexota bacterium]
MAIFSERIPSKRELFLVFGACVVPIHIWAIVNALRATSSWILSMNLWDVLGTFAYTQAMAFVESLLYLLGLVVLSIVLPLSWMRRRFVVQGAVLAFVVSISSMITVYYSDTLPIWTRNGLLQWLMVIIFISIVISFLLSRIPKAEKMISQIVEKMTILAALYILIDMLSIVVIFFRNIG